MEKLGLLDSDRNDGGSAVGSKDGTAEGSRVSVDGDNDVDGSCEGDKEGTHKCSCVSIGKTDGNDDGSTARANDGTKEGLRVSVEGSGKDALDGGKEGTKARINEGERSLMANGWLTLCQPPLVSPSAHHV